MVLTDTRHREYVCNHYTTCTKEILGPHARCLHSPVSGHKSSVGGQIIVVSHTWSGSMYDHFTDPSGLGLVSGIKLSAGAGHLLIMHLLAVSF